MRGKKKLIRTYIYSVYYVLGIFKRVEVGYTGEQERESRCERFKRKYLCCINFDKNEEADYLWPSTSFIIGINKGA